MIIVNPVVMTGFWQLTPRFEGVCRWMYLDILGLVTTGIGNLINTPGEAALLPWKHPDGRLATFSEKVAEWNRVASLKGKRTDKGVLYTDLGGGAFERFTTLRLDQDDVNSLVNRVAHNFVLTMKHRFASDFDLWPLDAQLATLSMAWANGPALDKVFPKLVKALKAGDWLRAEKECHINTDGADRIPGTKDDNRGIIPRNVANKTMYRNAHAVVADGLDDRVLYWPEDLRPLPLDLTTVVGQQTALKKLGFDPGGIDGDYGPKTRAAAIAYQESRELHADGVIGPKTRAALEADLKKLEAGE